MTPIHPASAQLQEALEADQKDVKQHPVAIPTLPIVVRSPRLGASERTIEVERIHTMLSHLKRRS